jgi:nitrite reductase/ring-hydroxylating ferredoxin subunit/(2Fe-2S) ferredoxin
MGQYECHVFVCTSGDVCPQQGDVEAYVKEMRSAVQKAGKQIEVRVNKAGCFSQCGHGPMIVVYPDNVWYAGVQASDLGEIVQSHIFGGKPVERLRYDPGKPGANKIDLDKVPAKAEAAASGGAWKRVCRLDEVPSDGIKQFTVDGTSVAVARAGSDVFACQALCPHEAISLEEGVHDGATLTCLEHRWQFDLKTGAPLGDATCGLTTYPAKQENGEIFISL